ncbi:hypothetical protein ABZZ44_05845 [Streptomyces sp. NPDC006460]|uniref:hypothetical protein n=1 Tax=Streptomyces sp. NPDC006460 TaxID=3154304 RepID=UPI0033B788C3
MTGTHRPLSDWVVRLGPPPVPGTSPINDGDERADARDLPLFTEGWVRRAVAAGPDRSSVLALHHPATAVTYVELDDHGAPLRIGEAGAELIGRVETSWPHPVFGSDDLTALAGLSREVRYLLLHRLDREGAPPPGLFHALPWEPVTELASAVVRLLDGGATPSLSAEALDLGHWVTPAALGVTGPLEQLYEGLTEPDPVLAARGGTALCAGLRAADPARFPAAVTAALAEVARRLAAVNPFLRHAAVLAAEGLTGATPAGFAVPLEPALPKSASGTADRTVVRRTGEEDGPFAVRTETTPGGRLKVTVELTVEATPERERLLDAYGGAFLPVVVASTGGTLRYWVALEARRRWLSGTLDVPVVRGEFRAEEAVTGVWGLSGVSPDELLPSLAGTHRAGLRVWRAAAELSPAGHPLRRALRRFDGEGGAS